MRELQKLVAAADHHHERMEAVAQLTSLDHANEANETRQVPPLAAPLAAHLPSVADVERAVGHAIAVASTAMNDVNLEFYADDAASRFASGTMMRGIGSQSMSCWQ